MKIVLNKYSNKNRRRKNMKKDYVVYSLKVANFLMNEGFKLKGSAINTKFPKYMVYYFENTTELRAAIDKYESIKTAKGCHNI